MSKNKKKNWFSSQKVIDEIQQFSLEGIEGIEELAIENSRKDHEEDQISRNNETKFTHIPGKKSEKVSKDNQLSEHATIKSKEISLSDFSQEIGTHSKISKEEAEQATSTKAEEKSMTNKEVSEEKPRDTTIEQLTFEIKELMLENERLITIQEKNEQKHSKKVQEIEVERNNAQNKINELDRRLSNIDEKRLKETIQELKQQLSEVNDVWQKEKQEYESALAEKEAVLSELTQELTDKEDKLQKRATPEHSEELLTLKETIVSLREENEALKIENDQFQAEISEVLVFARRKANRTIQEAKIESDRMIRTTDMRIDAIHDQAKTILFQVAEVKENVIGLFDDLHEQVHQLSDKKLLFEEFDK